MAIIIIIAVDYSTPHSLLPIKIHGVSIYWQISH